MVSSLVAHLPEQHYCAGYVALCWPVRCACSAAWVARVAALQLLSCLMVPPHPAMPGLACCFDIVSGLEWLHPRCSRRDDTLCHALLVTASLCYCSAARNSCQSCSSPRCSATATPKVLIGADCRLARVAAEIPAGTDLERLAGMPTYVISAWRRAGNARARCTYHLRCIVGPSL